MSPDVIDPFGELTQLCMEAKRVARFCEALGFEFKGAEPLIQHLHGHLQDATTDPWHGAPDPIALLEDPDQRPYLWDLED